MSETIEADIQPLRVVGIGASAGGLKAIEALFDAMPSDTGLAFVLIQHLSPDYKSLMDELLARHTQMPIIRVEGPTRVQANTIFLLPPRKNMVIRGDTLELVEQDHSSGANYPIDQFFKSLAGEVEERSIAIVLSGTGSDGSRGVRAIKESGGMVLVQSVESASFDGMPINAIATRAVDVVCTPRDMPERIKAYIASPTTFIRDLDRDQHGAGAGAIDRVFSLFRRRYGIDFSLYKAGTIDRRLERRMQFSRISNLDHYLNRLEADPAELAHLYRDLLVEVTRFFRDPVMYERLTADVIPQLIRQSKQSRSIRVWVPGCATGEEAYSLAMRFHSVINRMGAGVSVKIFATDVHSESLEIASTGVYGPDAMEGVSEVDRQLYFSKRGGLYHVSTDIRRMVIFARHDLIRDPPFTRLDLISCRNLLIYFQPKVQQRTIALFHFGLRTGGAMVLGPSESVRPWEQEFESVDNRWKIFRKLRNIRLRTEEGLPHGPPRVEPVIHRTKEVPTLFRPRTPLSGGLAPVFQQILGKHLPPSLLVDERGALVHVFGEAREYLSQPEGPVTTELVKLLSGDLRLAVSTGFHRARFARESTVVGRVQADVDGVVRQLRVSVEPFEVGSTTFMLVSIAEIDVEVEPKAPLRDFDVQKRSQEQLGEMERELDLMRESLQTTIEELETSNEELQATNEELVASNEELQSTNEELQSVNEELHTVNSEHQRKIEELLQVYNDLDHLIKATGTAILYLDDELRIRRFTEGIRAAFNLLPHDIGRPIEHISHNLLNPHIMSMLRDANERGEDTELAVATQSGVVLLLRIIPYVSDDPSGCGVLVTITQGDAVAKVKAEAMSALAASRRSDSELVEFAYAVSHDLQASLRHLTQGVTALQVKEGEQPDPQIWPQHLNRVTRSAERLKAMIGGLLTYSRIHTRTSKPRLVSLDRIVDKVVRTLSPETMSGELRLERSPLPELMVDANQIEILFFHLLDNAIKYTGDEPPEVKIECRREGSVFMISVVDNGVGIEARNLERIFVIFQRNHHGREVPGLGMGLALCRRIVERHGGELTVVSTPGKGSTFTFWLVDADAEEMAAR